MANTLVSVYPYMPWTLYQKDTTMFAVVQYNNYYRSKEGTCVPGQVTASLVLVSLLDHEGA